MQYYRARYNSEGVRAPLKGVTENYPTVQVCIIIAIFTTLMQTALLIC